MQVTTKRERLHDCGRRRIAPTVQLRVGSRGAGYAGVMTCGSIWACPVCAASIRQERANNIQAGVGRHIAAGGGGLFVTLTLPHGKKDPLRPLLLQVARGWSEVMRRKAGRQWRDRLGLVGYIRAVEVTYGRHGWHPHLHLLLLTEGDVGADTREAFASWLQAEWIAWASDRAWKGTAGEHAVDVQDVVADDGISRYLAKVQDERGVDRVLGLELARGDMKEGRNGNRTPFELLADLVLLDDATDPDGREGRRLTALWREFEEATAGLSAVRWSKGLHERLGVDERTDEQIAADLDLGDDVQTVLRLDPHDWHVLCRSGARAELLDVVETRGAEAARAFVWHVLLQDLDEWAAAYA